MEDQWRAFERYYQAADFSTKPEGPLFGAFEMPWMSHAKAHPCHQGER